MEKQGDFRVLLTIKEAGAAMGISERTMYRLIKAGTIKPIYLTSDTPRIARAQLEKMVEEMASDAAQGADSALDEIGGSGNE